MRDNEQNEADCMSEYNFPDLSLPENNPLLKILGVMEVPQPVENVALVNQLAAMAKKVCGKILSNEIKNFVANIKP